MSGRAVEFSGHVDVLRLIRPGTITLGNCHVHSEFLPAPLMDHRTAGASRPRSRLLMKVAARRSIAVLAKEKFGLRGREKPAAPQAQFIPFTAQTRMSLMRVCAVNGMNCACGA